MHVSNTAIEVSGCGLRIELDRATEISNRAVRVAVEVPGLPAVDVTGGVFRLWPDVERRQIGWFAIFRFRRFEVLPRAFGKFETACIDQVTEAEFDRIGRAAGNNFVAVHSERS